MPAKTADDVVARLSKSLDKLVAGTWGWEFVVSDCVASPNAELHEGSLRFFKARYPTHTAGEVLAALRTARSAAGAA